MTLSEMREEQQGLWESERESLHALAKFYQQRIADASLERQSDREFTFPSYLDLPRLSELSDDYARKAEFADRQATSWRDFGTGAVRAGSALPRCRFHNGVLYINPDEAAPGV